MGKHTPGLWECLYPLSGPGWIDIRSDDDGVIVAQVQHSDDARLIAAAPDLLGALRALLDHYLELVNSGDAGFWDPEKEYPVVLSRAALAKVTGNDPL